MDTIVTERECEYFTVVFLPSKAIHTLSISLQWSRMFCKVMCKIEFNESTAYSCFIQAAGVEKLKVI